MPAASNLVALSEVKATAEAFDPPRIVGSGFRAWLEGQEVWVTAVLERTAVWHSLSDTDRFLAAQHKFLVDPAAVPLHPPSRESLAAAKGREKARARVGERKAEGKAGGRPSNYGKAG